MTDLISREYVLTEYDRQHQGPPGGARKMMEEAPTIDAIPVEWLKAQNNSTKYFKTKQGQSVELILKLWQKEQEAQK